MKRLAVFLFALILVTLVVVDIINNKLTLFTLANGIISIGILIMIGHEYKQDVNVLKSVEEEGR